MSKPWAQLFLVFALLLIAVPAAWAGIANVSFDPGRVQWDVQSEHEGAVLTVSLPGGEVVRQEFEANETPIFELASGAKDGAYTYELRLVPRIDASLRQALAEARKSGDEAAIARLRAELPESPVVSGGFMVQAGSIVTPEGEEPQGSKGSKAATSVGSVRNVTAAEVIPEDLIVQGSICVGLDCGSSESFGFDTIRLKENNTRIKFEDTSTASGFPSNDWQLTANDSTNGGSNKFSVEDIDGTKVPFTITAGAASNSIYVDNTGRVGFRTSTPALDLHVSTSNTPAIRLEQTSGGFAAQTWDIGANEADFFVRDVTGGSTRPFRIRPGAPTSSLDISADGDVGVGTASPDLKLDVECDLTANGCVDVTNSSATGHSAINFTDEAGASTLFLGVDNNGNTSRFNSVNNHPIIFLTQNSERFRIDSDGDVGIGTASPDLKLDVECNLTANGCVDVTNSSATGHSAINFTDEAGTSTLFLGVDNSGNTSRFNSVQNFPYVFLTNNTERVRIDSDGDVGIGTASPSNKVDIQCNSAAATCGRIGNSSATGFSGWEFEEEGGTVIANISVDNANNNFRLNSTNSFPIVMLTNSTEHVRVDSDGDVGINCNNPTSDLVIASGGGCSTPSSSINAGATSFTSSSSRYIKENLEPVRVPGILQKISAINVYKYDFIGGPKDKMGLMAEDFHQVFRRGSDKLLDGQEVDMALWLAVKELTERISALEAELAAVKGETP